jgi:hypothetical protein
MAGIILRDLTPEKHHWISETIPAGTQVQEFMGCTYGCISPEGIAVVLPNKDYFIEVPLDAVKWEV